MSCSEFKPQGDKKVFKYNEPKGITSLDPAFARSMSNTWAVNMLFNGLVQLDSQLNIQPSIAKNWTISSDGKIYRFYLRNDVYFHKDPCFGKDSTRLLTARDFVYSFNRLLDPKLASPGKWVFANVSPPVETPFVAVSDTELVISLKQAFPPFLGLLAMQYCSVVPEEAIKSYGNDFRMHPIGTGPFRFFLWKEGVKLVLHRNPLYYEKDLKGKRLPYLDAVSVSFLSDAQSSFMAFLQGRTDMLNGLDDGSYKDAILTRSGDLKPELAEKIYAKRSAFLNTEYLGFLVSDSCKAVANSPVTNSDFRKAVNYAIDRRKMIRYLRNSIGIPGEHGLVPPFLYRQEKNRVKGYGFNLRLARYHLNKSGYAKNPVPVKLFITAQYTDLCEFIQHELEAIGIKASLEVNPPGTHGEIVARGQAPFFRKSWVADYPDAENYLSLLYSKNYTPAGPNYTLYASSLFDTWYEKSLRPMPDTMRESLYSKMDSLSIADAPMVILFYDESLRFLQKRVKALPNNPLNLLDLKRCKLEP